MSDTTPISTTPPHEQFFEEACGEARKALCLRARCGAVIVLDGRIIGRGFNAPPQNDIRSRKCDLAFTISRKPKSDRTCCVHAEWRAIMDALGNGGAKGGTLYFARVDETGALKKSREPYCTVCSRLALDVGILRFGLWQGEGIRLYDTAEYNDLSYQFHLKKE